MIQRATDPNSSRSGWRPTAAEAKDSESGKGRSRSGHAWPFISRHGERAEQQDSKRAPSNDSGS